MTDRRTRYPMTNRTYWCYLTYRSDRSDRRARYPMRDRYSRNIVYPTRRIRCRYNLCRI